MVWGLAFVWLQVIMSVGTAQAAIVHYTLDNVILADGEPITGTFDWTFSVGDFEGGRGVFTALEIPWRPNNSAPPLEQPGMVLTIEDKQIEISLDGNFHDFGLDISLKFLQPLSPTQSTLIDLAASFFECCGNGFKDQPFISGSISPIPELVRIVDKPGYYSTLQAAFDAAFDGDIILSQGITFNGNLYIDDDLSNKSVSFIGGYNNDFTEITGITSLTGNMIVSYGVVTIENFIIE
jgi:hypothetical protein